MSKNSEKVKRWRKRLKSNIVKGFGGGCAVCKIQWEPEIYDIHHLDPTTKKFTIGQVMSKPQKFEVIKEELKKCVLLCAYCHRLVHAGKLEMPKKIPSFNPDLMDAVLKPKKVIVNCEGKKNKARKTDKCPVCQSLKDIKLKYCSHTCAKKARRKVPRPPLPQLKEDLKSLSYVKVGKKYGVSDNTIRKWIKAYKN